MKEDKLAVECNDEGVDVLRQFLPACMSSCDNSKSIPFDYGFKSKTLLAIQVNIFECGGIAIGMCMAHRLVDASTMFTFITDWAATARHTSQQNTSPCTRVEAVTSFMWKLYMDSVRAKNQTQAASVEKYRALYTVNLRPRIAPPLPANSFGNIYSFTIALSTPSDENDIDDSLREDVSSPNDLNLVGKVRDAIKKIYDKYTRKLQSSEDELVNDVKPLTSGEAIFLGISSWCRLPIYEADFGWGKPTWVSIGTIALRNTAFLMDTKSGDGIEAFVNMTKEDMDDFEIKLLADQ
ncbi:hypothetical protein MKX03_022245 [Papaver bracteatum]|nr:hypothetical protein MKX03_022245 [Papaver bracteatum]